MFMVCFKRVALIKRKATNQNLKKNPTKVENNVVRNFCQFDVCFKRVNFV